MHTSTHSRRRLRRFIAAAVALVVFAGACGDDGSSSFTADALGASGPEAFCAVLVDAIGSGQTETNPTKPELENTITLLTRAGNLLPSSAPSDIGVFIETLLVVADTSIGLIDGGDASDLSEEAIEAVQVLDELDFDQMGAWIQGECEGVPGVNTEVMAGLTSGNSSPSSSGDGFTTDANSMNSDDIIDAATTTTTTTIPIETIALSDGGDPANYRATLIQVESVIATNAHPEDFMADLPAEEGVNYLSITMYAETEDRFNYFSADSFVLIGPDDRPSSGEVLTDTRGAVSGTVSLDSRDSETFVVSFTTDELITDLDGWILRLDREGRVPETISMGETVEVLYPLELDTTASGTVSIPSALGSCDPAAVDISFDAVDVLVESVIRDEVVRINAGERYVQVTIDAENGQLATGGGCDNTIPIFSYEFRLEADGRPLASVDPGGPYTYLGPGESRRITLIFTIPADTATLALVGEQDERIGEWDVSLPVVDGE